MFEVSVDPLPLIILQCAGCNSIVGDTSEFACVATWSDTRLVVLRAATNVRVDRMPQQSLVNSESLAHFPICCSSCGSVVGRMYTSVPSSLVSMKDMFALDASKCTSYKVGSAEVRVENSDRDGQQGNMATLRGTGAKEGLPLGMNPDLQQEGTSSEVVSRIEVLEAELLKMQHIILLHDTQLQQLPGYQSMLSEQHDLADHQQQQPLALGNT